MVFATPSLIKLSLLLVEVYYRMLISFAGVFDGEWGMANKYGSRRMYDSWTAVEVCCNPTSFASLVGLVLVELLESRHWLAAPTSATLFAAIGALSI